MYVYIRMYVCMYVYTYIYKYKQDLRRKQLLLEAELSDYRADCEKAKKNLEGRQRKQRLQEINDGAAAAAEAAAIFERFVCVCVCLGGGRVETCMYVCVCGGGGGVGVYKNTFLCVHSYLYAHTYLCMYIHITS